MQTETQSTTPPSETEGETEDILEKIKPFLVIAGICIFFIVFAILGAAVFNPKAKQIAAKNKDVDSYNNFNTNPNHDAKSKKQEVTKNLGKETETKPKQPIPPTIATENGRSVVTSTQNGETTSSRPRAVHSASFLKAVRHLENNFIMRFVNANEKNGRGEVHCRFTMNDETYRQFMPIVQEYGVQVISHDDLTHITGFHSLTLNITY